MSPGSTQDVSVYEFEQAHVTSMSHTLTSHKATEAQEARAATRRLEVEQRFVVWSHAKAAKSRALGSQ